MAKIIGNTTAMPNPRADWAQTDETKADYIKNKPNLTGLATEDYARGIALTDTLFWDGNQEKRVYADYNYEVLYRYVKISDFIPNKEDFKNGVTYRQKNRSMGDEVFTLTYEDVAENFDKNGAYFYIGSDFAIIPTDNYSIKQYIDEFIGYETIVFPEAGIYFLSLESGAVYTSSLSFNAYTDSIKFKDRLTGVIYELCVIDGKLTLKGGDE